MIDLETMIKSLRLAWLKRVFVGNEGTWKNHLHYLLRRFGVFFCSTFTVIIMQKTLNFPLKFKLKFYNDGWVFEIIFLQRNLGTI